MTAKTSSESPSQSGSFLELSICIAGIYGCFLTWGFFQERVSTTSYDGEKFRYFVMLNIVQALIASLVGFVYLKIKQQHLLSTTMSRTLIWYYLRLSIISSLASPFGYASLKHIDYPTFILGKTCKLVPVVLMNFLIYRKVFSLQTYLVVALITAGVSSFMLLNPTEGKPSKGASSNSFYGLFLLSINLMLDGATNSTQDQLFHKFKVSGTSMMVFMNFFSALLMILYLLVNPYTTELSDALLFFEKHPSILTDMFLFGATGALGQCFIFHTLEKFGALVLVTVTVTRKMFSILLSVFLFGHHLSWGQWGSVALVFLGIAWESKAKSSGKTKHKVNEEISSKELKTSDGKAKSKEKSKRKAD